MKKICINTVRNLPGIQKIIDVCAAFGRTWGRKGSPLHGSHIAFITEDEVVLLIQNKKTGKLRLLNFGKCSRGLLAETIAVELEENNITLQEEEE